MKFTSNNSICRKVFQLFILFGAAAILYMLILTSHRLKVSLLQTQQLPHVVSRTSAPIIRSDFGSKDPIKQASKRTENVGDLFHTAVSIAHSELWSNDFVSPFGNNYYPISESDTLLNVSMVDIERFQRQKRDWLGKLSKPVDISRSIKTLNRQITYIAISPDKRFIGYESVNYDNNNDFSISINLASLDGSKYHTWKTHAKQREGIWLNSNIIWSRDSKSLICLRGTLTKQAFIDKYQVSGGRRKSIRRSDLFCTFSESSCPWLMAITPKGRIIATHNSSHRHNPGDFDKSAGLNYPTVEFFDFGVRKNDREIHYFEIPTPRGLDEGCAAVSPEGTRIFWLADNEPSVTSAQADKTRIQKLLISKLDGSVMREIGQYKVPLSLSEDYSQPRIIDPKWSPDGMHVEFLLKDTVYSMPVNLRNN